MKRIFLLILMVSGFCAKAQNWVYFTDYNFRTYMMSNYYGCFNAYEEMDESCILGITYLDISGLGINNLNELGYFTNLQYLNCSNNNISSINPPSSLISLDFSYNQVTSYYDTNLNLQNLNCSHNNLTSFYAPYSLISLDFSYNQVINYYVDQDLQTLICNDNQLTTLEIYNNNSLIILNCSNNQLTSINNLGSTIQTLNCSNNQINQIPYLTSNLETFDCSNNIAITCLPTLPNSLTSLNINSTSITCIPNAPIGNNFGYTVCSGPFVGIPDINLRTALMNLYPTCFNANQQMDTTCSSILNANYLNLENKGIINSQGIEYFQNLDTLKIKSNRLKSFLKLPNSLLYLDCSSNYEISNLPNLPNTLLYLNCNSNGITNLPNLPNNLLYLYCKSNGITSLPSLPTSLTHLDCDGNQLVSLPTLPIGLTTLSCSDNQITTLPNLPNSLTFLNVGLNGYDGRCNKLTTLPTLPSGLQVLYCEGNFLSNFSSITLPASLQTLICRSNQITALPSLPASLRTLTCAGNKITNLPTLPNGLQWLICGYDNSPSPYDLSGTNGGNLITNLPPLPSSLTNLVCNNNKLTSLPTLPSALSIIECKNNLITSLPSLPNSLTQLDCSKNFLLSCLPLLPNSLSSLYTSNTSITCFPNSTTNFPSVTLCGSGSSCEPRPTASGIIFHDINANGVYNVGIDSLLPNWMVINTNGWSSNSYINGQYQMKLNLGVVNTLTISPPTPYIHSILPASINITPSTSGLQGSNYNFALRIIPNIQDLKVTSTSGFARPGFNQWTSVAVNNVGTKDVSNATLKVLKPTNFTFLNANPVISQQVGDTLIWNNVNINVLQQKGFNINWNVPANAILGDTFHVKSWIEPLAQDTTPLNNYFDYKDIIRGSYDPNDKTVSSNFIDSTTLNQNLHYTIRFQNTGTDTAFTVVLRDTLSNFLDMSTFKILDSSHNYSFIIRDHSLLEVFFQNINLPDSFVNEPNSHGFVTYSIKPKSNLIAGNVIENRSRIYFDYNAPIITNTTVTKVLPNAPIASNSNICNGNNTTLFAFGQSGSSFAWYTTPSGGTPIFTGSIFTTNSLSSDTIYYVEQIANNCTSLSRKAVTVVVHPTPNAPTSSNSSICTGNSANLNASANGQINWYDGSNNLVLGNSNLFSTPSLSTNTSYFVENIENGCTSARTQIDVIVNATPNAPTSSNSTICAGTNANLNASANGQINWYDSSNNLVLNNSNNFTTPSLSTNTSYFVENIENGCTSARTQIDVIVNAPNAPMSSNSSICAGNSTNLNASASGQINWYDGSNNLVLGNSNTFTTPSLSTNTSYFVENIENGCTSARTQIDVIVTQIPTASFLVNGNDLTASPSGLTYQWLFNGNPISGANSMNYAILQDGTYSVIVSDGTCSDTSATQNVVYMSLNSMISSEIKIFPNPTHGKLTIEVQNEQAKFELYDLNGKLLISKELNSKVTNLDLQNIAKGLYLVKIKDLENKIYMQKLVVE